MAEVIAPAPVPIRATPILQEKLHPWTQPQTTFEASKHLSYDAAPKVLSMADIGLPEDTGISSTAVSEPFPLFTEDAIRTMRDELFTNELWEDCAFSTEFAGCQLRGHCPNYAPFMHAAWTDPSTLKIVSDIAGVDLIPVYDYDIGNINIAVMDPNDALKKTADNSADEMPVTKWHVDSYPFVCVVMMSDTTNMVGGETAVKTGTGEVLKIRGPSMGSAIVLQGRYITHQALAAMGGSERITMITSFRARNPFVADKSNLGNIRPISEQSELYFQWTQYRIDVLQKRLEGMRELLEEEHRLKKTTDKKRIKDFLVDQAEWLSDTNREIQ